ncbi:MAG: hypothetical protein WBQ34_10220 [Candidatus Acidiferrales bacterium]
MNDTDREKWKRVATRIGVWKPHRCSDPSDPAMIVAMLDYLLLKRGCALSHFDGLLSVEVPHANQMKYDKSKQIGIETDDTPESLHAALINAIDALPEEAHNG